MGKVYECFGLKWFEKFDLNIFSVFFLEIFISYEKDVQFKFCLKRNTRLWGAFTRVINVTVYLHIQFFLLLVYIIIVYRDRLYVVMFAMLSMFKNMFYTQCSHKKTQYFYRSSRAKSLHPYEISFLMTSWILFHYKEIIYSKSSCQI